MREREGRRTPLGRLILLLALVIIFGVLVVPRILGSVLAIQDIQVQGLSQVPTKEAIEASGVRIGDNIAFVDAARVRDGINSHRYLELVGMFRSYFPNTLVLTVKEDSPRAKIIWMGMLLLLGKDGIVLERNNQIDMQAFIPEIVGMTVTSNVVGKPVTYGVAGQAEAVAQVLDVLERYGLLGMVEEINIAEPDRLILVTDEGVQIVLGSADQLEEKVALARDVLPRLEGEGQLNGSILDVSGVVSADFRPRAVIN